MMQIFKENEDKIEIIIAGHEHIMSIKNVNEDHFNFQFPYILRTYNCMKYEFI